MASLLCENADNHSSSYSSSSSSQPSGPRPVGSFRPGGRRTKDMLISRGRTLAYNAYHYMRNGTLAGLLLSLLLSLACSNAEPALRWAADPNSNAPYAFYSSGKTLAGFEYEIINAIARRLGRSAEFVQNDWS